MKNSSLPVRGRFLAVAAGIYDFRRLPRVINVPGIQLFEVDALGGTAASHYPGRRLQVSRRRRAMEALRSGCLLPGPVGGVRRDMHS